MADESDFDRIAQERDLYLRLLEVAHAEEIEPLLKEALALAVKVTRAERGRIHVFRQDGADYEWSMQHPAPGEGPRIESIVPRSIEAEARRTGRLVNSRSARLDPRFSMNDSVQSLEAVMCVPLGIGDPIGVVYLFGGPTPRPFSEADIRLAELLALHLAPPVRWLAERERESRAKSDPTKTWRQRLRVEGLIGRSESMAEVFGYIASVAPLDVGVLLTGPSGAGKSAIARAIHQNSRRQAGPFVEINCAALPEALVESELFGAKAGAHSAASVDQMGKVAAAEGGTLFLDEIGDMPPQSQAKLLGLIDRKTYARLGDPSEIAADIRIIAATNADLKALVQDKKFREDLFFRLNVVPHRVPSLAERVDDLDLLCDHFRDLAAHQNRLPRLQFSPRARIAVRTASWPGNIRELSNAVQAALIRASTRQDEQIQVHHLFPDAAADKHEKLLSYHEATRQCQAGILREALERNNGNVAETARELDLTRAHVYNLIKGFGLRVSD